MNAIIGDRGLTTLRTSATLASSIEFPGTHCSVAANAGGLGSEAPAVRTLVTGQTAAHRITGLCPSSEVVWN